MNRLGEVHSIETADGKYMFIPSSGVKMIAFGNYGSPQITYNTRKIHLQDGVTELNYTVEPRNIPVRMFKDAAATRQEYWNNRLRLHEFFRPNRNGELKLTIILPSGDKRTLDVRADPGMEFASQAEDNSWNIDETLNFVAFNPLWYNPVTKYVRLNGFIGAHLVFPITFPIQFGPTGYQFSGMVNYLGTWRSYPKITIDGPYTQAIIENVTTGKQISLYAAVADGDKRVLTLSPGKTSIVDANGVSKFGDLGPTSDLMDFTLKPAPEVPEGSNEGEFFEGTQAYSPARYYRFGEPSGEAQAVDYGTDGIAGVYNGSYDLDYPGALSDDPDTAIHFDGAGGSASLETMNFSGTSYTFEFFVRPGAVTDTALIFTADYGGTYYRIGVNDSYQLYVINDVLSMTTAANSVPQGVWTHVMVCFSLSSGVTSVYLNGVLAGNALLGAIGAGDSSIEIGTIDDIAGAPNLTRFVGDLDEFIIYKQNMTPTQVAEKYGLTYKARNLYATGGRQFITATLTGTGPNTNVVIEYNERYYGL